MEYSRTMRNTNTMQYPMSYDMPKENPISVRPRTMEYPMSLLSMALRLEEMGFSLSMSWDFHIGFDT